MTSGIYTSTERVLAALRDCAEQDRDDLGGGWHPSTVADGEPFGTGAAQNRLEQLRDAGAVMRVRGMGPYQPRDSYLPTDHDDAPADDSDGPRSRVWVDEHDA